MTTKQEPPEVTRLRLEIAQELYLTRADATEVWHELPGYLQEYWLDKALVILRLIGEVVADDQRIPASPYVHDSEYDCGYYAAAGDFTRDGFKRFVKVP
jgi:hypothetical protein